MFELLSDLLSYPFIIRALCVGTLVALCAALLGVSLVLKRYSMIGDGLSHVGFGTVAIAMALNLSPLMVSIPIVLVSAYLLLYLNRSGNIKGDALVAMVSASSLSLGVIIISMTAGMNTDVNSYLFGTILAISGNDLYLSVACTVVVLILYLVFYNKIFAITFDETFSRAIGTNTNYYNMLLSFLTAITIVVGMRMMGAMLISGLIVFPPVTSMRLFGSFKSVVICSAVLSFICFFLGIFLSFVFSTPAGASVIVVNLAAFFIFSCLRRILRRG